MKLNLILILTILSFCSCEIELREEIFTAKDAIEAEGNRAGLENLRKVAKSDGSVRRQGRVTGGQIANLGQFPYQALLFMFESTGRGFLCGGSLLTATAVLTAAHCVEVFESFDVYLGVNYFGPGASAIYGEFDIPYARSKSHPNYNENNFNNDVAFIYLNPVPSNVLSNVNVGFITLPNRNDSSVNLVGRNATVSGFGGIDDIGTVNYNLRFVATPVISNADCRTVFGSSAIIDSTLCTSGANSMSSCGGDSGGPVTAEITSGRRVLVGIVSFGAQVGCQLGFPAGNARVTSFLDWIEVNQVPSERPPTNDRCVCQCNCITCPSSLRSDL